LSEKLFVKGNEAVAMAAIEAGCRYYFGYPITPQSDIPEYLSRELPGLGGEFIQAESEVAAINMLLGASATGVRCMTSSSGPGISLKQEGISYMAGSELPGVIVDIMRQGPGLGGIDASQADYFQATRGGGHGGYRIIVLAPNSVQEMYDLTMLAFDLSDIYRMPAMVLADSVIGQMKESIVANPRPATALPDKPWAVRGRGAGTPQNVVKSLKLGDGEMEAFHWALHARYQELADKESRWEEFRTDDAELIVTAFGSTARIARTAVEAAREAGLDDPVDEAAHRGERHAEARDQLRHVELARRPEEVKQFRLRHRHGDLEELGRVAPGHSVHEPLEAGDHLVDVHAAHGAADACEGLARGSVERGYDEVGGAQLELHGLVGEQRGIREHGHLVLRVVRLQMRDDAADAAMQRRFAGAGEGHVVDLGARGEHAVQLVEHGIGGHPFAALQRARGAPAAFAVDAIERAGLEGQQVDAQ